MSQPSSLIVRSDSCGSFEVFCPGKDIHHDDIFIGDDIGDNGLTGFDSDSSSIGDDIECSLPSSHSSSCRGRICFFFFLVAGVVAVGAYLSMRDPRINDIDPPQTAGNTMGGPGEGTSVVDNTVVDSELFLAEILEGLGNTITEEAITTPGTAENDAFEWLKANTEVTDELNVVQRYIMTLLYMELDGDSWSAMSPLRATNECEWPFLGCTDDNKIFRISIDNVTATGTIPPALGKLPFLERLSLEDNEITGSLPNIIGELPLLSRIDIDNNQFTGQIPESFYSTGMLEVFDADSNLFTGTISENVANLTKLIHFSFSNNKLSGNFPSKGFRTLTKLQNLVLMNNTITGAVGARVCDLFNKTLGNLVELWADCEDLRCACCTFCL
mmetsp:Transcript_40405/g.79065  ORF Transcript_40405/g.79065 Transcript_40405/m.79065 type:complete len:385 (+) Transcript_40405:122-1276(+)|eukprot:CAMPEP_0194326446 /NCGR_PEP_ID=MMETSP0171-20130528/36468_1 /TAXON_ID=218684 /ORGANISM="Corethron pennatum, Strain L29A3" /LENGTH=384 /DNA_ID=CAMNT_0039086019 /DNA_START=50 /DNA_END=1204 /DNA_ORIENTATION=-